MDIERSRNHRNRDRLKRLLRYSLYGLAYFVAFAIFAVIAFWVAQKWLVPPPDDSAPVTLGEVIRGSESILIDSGGVVLGGELALPTGDGPHPAMVVVHGSGRQGSANYHWVAETYTKAGFAVLTYDKRGVGRSSGTYTGIGPENSEAALYDLASDALAGVSYLKAHPAVDGGRIGLFGVSQAGWIIPLAASRSADVAFMVIVSGPTVTVGEEIYYSDLTGDDQGRPSDLGAEEIAERLASYAGPRGFDPVPALETLTIPGIWILGGRDRSIPIPETVAILERLTEEGKPFQVELFPEGNHRLRTPSGERIAYLPKVSAWLETTVASL